MTVPGLPFASVLAVALLLASPCIGQEPKAALSGNGNPFGGDVFKVPALALGLRLVDASVKRGDPEGAVAMLQRLIDAVPDATVLQTVQAGLAGEASPATSGQPNPGTEKILAEFAAPVPVPCQPAPDTGVPDPAPVQSGHAPVGAGNTIWDPGIQRLRSGHEFPPILASRPLAPSASELRHGGLPAPAQRRLHELYVERKASGLAGVLYDNRDKGHSSLPQKLWPQLAVTDYSAQAQAAGVNYGLNTQILFDAVTIGNSSTAFGGGGALWRSQPRLAMTSQDGAARLYQLYANDHLYVFPEHRDHDPASKGGKGDVLTANTPYLLISQGSSGSDRPFLAAMAAIIAAFTPDTRAFLEQHRLVAPTVQMVFRRSFNGVSDRESYMSGAAHPSVFRASDIDPMRLIGIANALAAGDVPPMPCLAVVQESHPRPRVGYYADRMTELLFDTPSAIARVWRSVAPTRTMVVSAAATRDPNGRPLRFHWRVLRGDPERIEIVPADDTAATVELTIGWHERRPVPGMPELTTDRVDIAVFADNGRELSAPGFVTIVFPADQRREYEELPGGALRVISVDYADGERSKRYVDPLIFPRRDWRDRYAYDTNGDMLGWARERPGKPAEAFTRYGHRVLERDPLGRPERAEEIAYPVRQGKKGILSVDEVPTGRTFDYMYFTPDDRHGLAFPE